jgi:hypothetical protein
VILWKGTAAAPIHSRKVRPFLLLNARWGASSTVEACCFQPHDQDAIETRGFSRANPVPAIVIPNRS